MNKEDDYIKEKELANQPKAIPLEDMITLVDLTKTHVCKITCKDGTHGTGFFCYIPIGWGNILPTLLTNNHVLNINDIQPGETIKFSINNDYKEFNFLLDNTRKIYTNEYFDVTIIEIKEDDNIDEKSFFDLDKQIFQEDSVNIFRNKQIYLLHYPKGIKMEISPGLIKNINEEEERKTIHHLCDTSGGSSGSPIINTGNFKVIGIHKGAPRGAQNYNLGTLLKEPIEKFNEEIKKKKSNNKDNKDNKGNETNIKIEEKSEKEEKENLRVEEKSEKEEKENIRVEEKCEIEEEEKNEIEEKENLRVDEKNEKEENENIINIKDEKKENEIVERKKIIENNNDKKNNEENKELDVNDEDIDEIIIK